MTKHKGRPVPPQPTPALDTSERRVRACLKACEGIATETLEAGGLNFVLDKLPEVQTVLAQVYTSADEVCVVPDGLDLLRQAVGGLYRGVGKMCDIAARPRTPDVGEQL